MFRLLLILMIVIPVIELWFLITVGRWIGAWPTVSLVILTGVLGAWLAKKEGLQTIRSVRMQLEKGQIPGMALLDGICILIGGVVLLTPGFFTDLIGFALLVPYTRNLFKAWLITLLNKWLQTGHIMVFRRK
jgi:UPF0716 protein FxsA